RDFVCLGETDGLPTELMNFLGFYQISKKEEIFMLYIENFVSNYRIFPGHHEKACFLKFLPKIGGEFERFCSDNSCSHDTERTCKTARNSIEKGHAICFSLLKGSSSYNKEIAEKGSLLLLKQHPISLYKSEDIELM